VVRFLGELFVAEGLTPCPWPELHPEQLRQAADVLAHAQTMRTASIALDQYNGSFDREWARISTLREEGKDLEAVTAMKELARHAPVGRRLTIPWVVAVAGPPNVGKSSLVNALAGYQRSIVSPVAGTTRDVVGTRIAIDGWPVELQDTAGIRPSADEIESAGIELARASVGCADLCLWLLDASAPPILPEKQDHTTLLIINKIDLPPAWEPENIADALRVSCLTGEGIEELLAAISRRLVPVPPAPGSAVPYTPELCDMVEETVARLAGMGWPLMNPGETR
jgi:tRNA modification GTPase